MRDAAIALGVIVVLVLVIYVGAKVNGANVRRGLEAELEDANGRLDRIQESLDAANLRLFQYIERTSFRAVASWYGPGFHGRPAADASIFDMRALTVAHPSLPFGTILWIENEANGKAVAAIVTDRGPFIGGRSLDVSLRVAQFLGMVDSGLAVVRCRILDVISRVR